MKVNSTQDIALFAKDHPDILKSNRIKVKCGNGKFVDIDTSARHNDKLTSALFDLSLHRTITSIYIQKSGHGSNVVIGTSDCKDGRTNIDADMIAELLSLQDKCTIEFERGIEWIICSDHNKYNMR